MTQDEIVRMSNEADIEVAHMNKPMTDNERKNEWRNRFAALVAAHEREACAKVCESGIDMWPGEYHEEWNDACEDRAAAIRARNNHG